MAFSIGAMVDAAPARAEAPASPPITDGAVRESVRHIVGVQLRNLATVGGSIYSRSVSPTYSPCSSR